MSKLSLWLDHRMEVVGLYTFKDLARYSGVAVASVRRVYCRGLDTVNRTERRLLAGSLRVSLRKLEQLDDGEIDWIDDSHVYDADVRSRPLPGQQDDPAYWMPKEVTPEDRGTPVIGSI